MENRINNHEMNGKACDASGSERAEQADRAGGNSNNMPPSIPQNDTETGGLDALSVSLYGRTNDPEGLEGFLREGKEDAQNHTEEKITEFHLQELIHHPTGGNAAGMSCMFRVTYNGVVFMIARRWNTVNETFPTMQAQVKSTQLMIHGYEGVKSIIYEFASLIGFEITSTRVNRVDICVDIQISMTEIQKAYFENRIVACTRKVSIHAIHGRKMKIETLQFGAKGAPVVLRMYDKISEVRRNESKYNIMKERRWGCDPMEATRVEYQIKGEWLSQEFSTVTLEQLEINIATIAEYLTTHWFRIIESENDHKHYERKSLSPLWRKVQEAFTSWVGRPITERKKKIKVIPKNEDMIKQVKGCLKTIFALNGWVPSTYGNFVTTISEYFKEEYKSFITDCSDRRRLIEMRYGDVFNLFPESLGIENPKQERTKVLRL